MKITKFTKIYSKMDEAPSITDLLYMKEQYIQFNIFEELSFNYDRITERTFLAVGIAKLYNKSESYTFYFQQFKTKLFLVVF